MADLLLYVLMKEFWLSVNVWRTRGLQWLCRVTQLPYDFIPVVYVCTRNYDLWRPQTLYTADNFTCMLSVDAD